MKKYRAVAVATIIALIITFAFAACTDKADGADNDATSIGGEHKIQYAIDGVTYTVDVKSGESYSIEVPERNGYVFLGLFDSEVGGTQYVNSDGGALALFSDNKNLLLFPRWAAKEYTLVLDYQGAEVTAERQLSVSYGSKLTSLPVGLKMENKKFVGWYTEPNKKGVRVADEYGVVPGNDMVSERNFDLSDPDGYIYLYAGFQGETFDVTFNFGSGVPSETVGVEYGTPVSEVELETRVGGKAVCKWSLIENDVDKTQIFTGKVTGAMILYAAEFAPVIDFYSDGDKSCPSVIAEAGTNIVLPLPVKENYAFKGWYDQNGTLCDYTVMPENSVRLTAKWYPMIIFDERGGKDVNDLCVEQGSAITLPTTEKAGYIFAGWYTETGDPYVANAMPEKSVKLRAMYRQIKTDVINVVKADESRYNLSTYNVSPTRDFSIEIDMSGLGLPDGVPIDVKGYANIKSSDRNDLEVAFDFYSSYTFSQATLISGHRFEIISDEYQRFTFESKWTYCEKVVFCFYHTATWRGFYFTDFYLEIEYPDMTKLY